VIGTSQPDGEVLAEQVVVDGVNFQGRLSSTGPGGWQIDFKTVYLSEATRLVDNPVPGDLVQVNAKILSDGSFLAESIRVAARQASPNSMEREPPEETTSPNRDP
jgi:hypothetical protein